MTSAILTSLLLNGYTATASGSPGKIEVTREPSAYGGVFLTKNLEAKTESDSFDCSDHVHLVVTDIAVKGRHVLAVQWVRPSGTEKELYSFEFDVEDEPRDARATLKFEPGMFGKVFNMDHTSGMEKLMGQWKVKVYLDERLVAEKNFYVVC